MYTVSTMHQSRRRHRQNPREKLILYALIGLAGFIVVGFVLALGVFAWYSRDLPSPGKLSQINENSTVFYDRDGKVLFEMYKDVNRVPVSLDNIAPYVKQGTVAVEDKDFYHHKGFSERGILRSVLNLLLHHSIQGGGSTITQQLIKNVVLGDTSQTASRKIKELILATEVERRYTKDQILEMYLNNNPYGGTFIGVGSAARGYFGKDPKDLSLVESAIIAGLPQSPSYYSPFVGKNDAWRGRTKDVLRRMREDKYITSAQEQQALKQLDSVKFTSPKLAINAPHFVFYIKDQIEKQYGSKILDQGLKIKTTLSLDAQEKAQDIVQAEIKKLKDIRVGNGAAVVLDSQTSDILAMVGSYDYYNDEYGAFNAATGKRQPGSTMKPITYALAFEKGYTPSTVLMDVKTVFPDGAGKEYIPVNYDGKFRGPVQLRFALGNSLNIPAVKLVAMVGVKDFLQKANDMGLSTLAPTTENLNRFGLSVTLGGGEVSLLDLTNAFTVFARGGTRKDIEGVMEIKDYKGKTIYKKVKSQETRVFSPEVSFLISHILSDNNARIDEFGPNSYLNVPGKTVAVKTGTTDDKKDNWAVGYTKAITVGVWVGNNDGTKMDPRIASGVTGASPIWHNIMAALLKKYDDGIINKPDKVKAVQVDSYLGGTQKDSNPTRAEYFIEGTEPKDISPYYKKIKISKATGKLANDVEIKQGNYDEKEFIVFTENDPVSTDGKNRWQEGIDAWVKDQGDQKFHPPTDKSDASADAVVVSIKAPNDHQQVDDNNVHVQVRIASVAAMKNVKIYINGSEVKNYDGDRKDVDDTINLSDGAYEMKVVARNEKDKTGDSTIRFGEKKPWESAPTATLTTFSSYSPTS